MRALGRAVAALILILTTSPASSQAPLGTLLIDSSVVCKFPTHAIMVAEEDARIDDVYVAMSRINGALNDPRACRYLRFAYEDGPEVWSITRNGSRYFMVAVGLAAFAVKGGWFFVAPPLRYFALFVKRPTKI